MRLQKSLTALRLCTRFRRGSESAAGEPESRGRSAGESASGSRESNALADGLSNFTRGTLSSVSKADLLIRSV